MKLLIFTALLVAFVSGISGEEPSLYDELFEKKQPRPTERVTFRGGAHGVRSDDMVMSDEINEYLFGGNGNFMVDQWDLTDINGTLPPPLEERKKRAGTEIKRGINFWPNGEVPYTIAPTDFDEEEKAQIKEAMRTYETLTCVRFRQRTQADKQWIHLHHTDDGCYSYLGDARAYSPGPQPVSLQKPGCRNAGTYLHELGHALGLVHEHQLPTRDAFVRYYGTNVDPLNIDQLEMYNPRVVNTYNTAYDLGSIMHYDITSFSVDDTSPTLGVDDPFLAQHIGRRYSILLSFGDVKTLNRLYKCAEKSKDYECGGKMASCPEPGFVATVNSKCKCMTPMSYFNEFCKDKEGFQEFCFKLAPTGRCDIQNIDHHRTCSKTCGFCPRFKPGESAIGPLREANSRKCMDRYYNPLMCKRWSGLCMNPWMQRNCRATCQACNSKIGRCANIDPDSVCDNYAKKQLCQYGTKSTKEFLHTRCADSCGTCGARNTDDSCRNVLSDAQCAAFAKEDMCERKPLEMFTKCPSTCNRCYWNKGSCSNNRGEAECIKMALSNLCTHGPASVTMKKQCPKTCNSC